MPKAQEEALRKEGERKHLTGKELDRFVYGTMYNEGWRKGENNDKESMHRRRKHGS